MDLNIVNLFLNCKHMFKKVQTNTLIVLAQLINVINDSDNEDFEDTKFECLVVANNSNHSDNRLYLKGSIRDHFVKILIDSGAAVNVVRKSLMDDLKIPVIKSDSKITLRDGI